MNTQTHAVPEIAMDSVESSQIHSLGYDQAHRRMAVRFKDRKTGAPTSLYHYDNVQQSDFDALKNAESIGSHFYKVIKPYPEIFPYRCIEKQPAAE
ncbi:KTSC domain-containing protein [Pararobbsia alpina]|uniref:KTSC domain-containing protein n=1 Tax=Pararobbsia alpina TaxID=621374 RepID=UPI0039A443C3